MKKPHHIGVTVTLLVFAGVAAGWWARTRSPPIMESAVPVSTVENSRDRSTSPSITPPVPIARRDQPTTAPAFVDSGGLATDRRLVEAARNRDFYQGYANRLLTQTVSELADRWPLVVARNDPDELPAFLAVFSRSLRISGDKTIYQNLLAILLDPQATVQAKAAVLALLGRTATPQAMEILTQYMLNGTPKDGLEAPLRDNIREATTALIDGHWNWDVSPSLEKAWRGRGTDLARADRIVLAQANAYLCTASGTRLLLDTASDASPKDPDRDIVIAALASLQRNEAVPALDAVLTASRLDTELRAAGMAALIHIGSADAYSALLKHLVRATDLSETQRQILRTELAERGLTEEGAKVIRESLEHEKFADKGISVILEGALRISHDQPEEKL